MNYYKKSYLTKLSAFILFFTSINIVNAKVDLTKPEPPNKDSISLFVEDFTEKFFLVIQERESNKNLGCSFLEKYEDVMFRIILINRKKQSIKVKKIILKDSKGNKKKMKKAFLKRYKLRFPSNIQFVKFYSIPPVKYRISVNSKITHLNNLLSECQ